MDQGAIAPSDRHSLVAVDDFPEPPDQTMISDDAGQAFGDPGAGLRPGHLLRQPARRISLDDQGMLFR